MKTKLFRILSLLLALLMLVGVCSAGVSALNLSQNYEVSWDHTLLDENGSAFTWHTGLSAANNPYGYDIEPRDRYMHDYTVKRLGLAGDKGGWTYDQDFLYAYCIEPGISLPDAKAYQGSTNENQGNKWKAMDGNQQKLIQLALTYGYPNGGDVKTAQDANASYAATQLIVWQIALGFRSSATALNDKTYPMSGYSGTMTSQLSANAHLKRFYDAILSDMAKHYTIPSFAGGLAATAPTYLMDYADGQYSLTLTDTNGVLQNFMGTDAGGVGVSVDGNTMTITSSVLLDGAATIAMTRRMPQSQFTTGFLIWSVPGKEGENQDMLTGVKHDPVPAYVNVMAAAQEQPKGTLRITKTATGIENPAGFSFEVRNAGNELIGTYMTDDSGRIDIPDLPAGNYSVKEINIPAWFALEGSNPKNVTVPDGSTGTVAFKNVLQQGTITVRKTNSDPNLGNYSLAGAVFEIWNPTGQILWDTITTNAAGVATSGPLDAGDYVVREKTAPNGFTRNLSSFPVTLAAGGSPEVIVPNQPQTGVIRITKSNAAPSNGDYSLAGAVFEVRSSGGTLVDTLTTDAQGKANSKQLPLGEYKVTEKTAPTGFLRNTATFTAKLTYGSQNDAVVYADVAIPEKPQTGKITIKKINAAPAMGDYPLSGAVFEIYSGSTLVDTLTTNAQGEAQSKALKLGSYTVQEKTAPYGYVLNAADFTVKLEYAGQDAELAVASVTVPEQPQIGIIRLTKANANPSMGDYSLKGAVFEVHDSQGKLFDTITTDAAGQAQTKELPLGSYNVSEKTAPYGFVRNQNTFGAQLSYAGQDVAVVYTDVVVAEQPQVGTITVTKRDVVTGDAAQGDATLAGAVFEVYASDKETLVDTIYCGAGVSAITKELSLGTYYVREKSAPVGYNLDEDFHQVKLEYVGQDVDVISSSYDLKNQVIQGQISITKHIDEPMEGYDDPQIEQPLDGAVFQIYLKSAGSYTQAKASERDQITTNEQGYAISKKLPYGLYVVEEVFAPGDVKLVAPFEVFIALEGKIYRFILNDIVFRSLIKVVKVDAETGKTIAVAGTTFMIRDLVTGEYVKQHINYPIPTNISQFETAPDGTLVLPEPLKSGEYELIEIVAPSGYLLSEEPVRFTVHSSQVEEIVIVTMENAPVMGRVTVEKTGNMLVGAKEIETIFGPQYLPLFEMGYLAGAEFDVVAAEDIITAEGTVRAKKGEVVDHIVTGEDGKALSKELYLGEYALVETKAPKNYVLDPAPHTVSLVYEDQTVAVVTSQIGISNARQLIEIELLKKMEGFGAFEHFEDVIFGLYTAEDIYAEGGKLIIAKDSLILTQDSLMALSALDDDGRGRFEGELPFAKYYVLELQTAEGFVLDPTKYPVDASYTGEDKAVTRIKVNGGEVIVNKCALGELRVLKLDAKTHEPLQGAKFGLFQGDKKLGEAVTDAKGYALFSDLAFGEYQVKELEAPEGYVLVDEIYVRP